MTTEDPTAIPVDVRGGGTILASDKRISGVAYHGNTPFDCPLISKVTDNLWQGGCEHGLLLPDEIDLVISLYPWARYELAEHQLRTEWRMYDSVDHPVDGDVVNELALAINVARTSGHTVLVHCQAGLNRSGLIAARALMLDGMSAADAIDLLRMKRSPAVLCNTRFDTWLREQA